MSHMAMLQQILPAPGTMPQVVADCLAKRGDEVSEALLSVTDRMARDSECAAVMKEYNAVRGSAAKHIEAALPNLGALVQKYAG